MKMQQPARLGVFRLNRSQQLKFWFSRSQLQTQYARCTSVLRFCLLFTSGNSDVAMIASSTKREVVVRTMQLSFDRASGARHTAPMLDLVSGAPGGPQAWPAPALRAGKG